MERLEPLERYFSHNEMSKDIFRRDPICHKHAVGCKNDRFERSEKDEAP